MNNLETIRYMGIKTNLLENIIPEIQRITPKDGIVLDIMAGSNAVSYALKPYFTVYTNDVQEYSKVISDAVIVNQEENISNITAKNDLEKYLQDNDNNHYYNYFEKTYSGTYFSQKQCQEIDSIRYAISKQENKNKQNLYLFALMGAMCKVQSTPGHFAQYMPANHSRIIPLQKMDLLNEFYSKCNAYSNLYFSKKNNKAFSFDFHKLLKENICGKVDTIYLDSPYTQEQYSRFYHVLETVVKYDNPIVHFKAKYRENRFMSKFCYKGKVEEEFRSIFNYCNQTKTNLVVSYSNHGLITPEILKKVACEYFNDVELKTINYKHSTQGKGTKKIVEILLICQIEKEML
ncbi:DNA adenine methylase [bacterium]|nr:DNA adenine methylase [bacterium]